MSEDELRDAIVLVFANKQDLPNAMSVSEITDALGLRNIRDRTVRYIITFSGHYSSHSGTYKVLVLHKELVYMKVWIGCLSSCLK